MHPFTIRSLRLLVNLRTTNSELGTLLTSSDLHQRRSRTSYATNPGQWSTRSDSEASCHTCMGDINSSAPSSGFHARSIHHPSLRFSIFLPVAAIATTGNPCVCDFAVCKFTGTRQIHSLPWAKRDTHGALQTHGKKYFCRVLRNKTHGIHSHTPKRSYLPCV